MIALLAILCFGEVLRESDPRIEYNFTDPDCLIWIDGECKVKEGDGAAVLWQADVDHYLIDTTIYYYTPCYDHLITNEQWDYGSRDYMYLYYHVPNPDVSRYCRNQSMIRVDYPYDMYETGYLLYDPEGNKNGASPAKTDCVVWFPTKKSKASNNYVYHSCAIRYAERDQMKEVTYQEQVGLTTHYFVYDPDGECLFYYRNNEICLTQNPNRIPPTLAFTYNGVFWNYNRPRVIIKLMAEWMTDFLN